MIHKSAKTNWGQRGWWINPKNYNFNKHTVSIAEAIHVPYRPQQISKRAITHVKVGQTRPKSNLTCIMLRQIIIWNFNSICRKMTKKSPENEILAKGNNSFKSRSNATKVKLELYYVKKNPYTKFQVNISKDDWEKFGKPSGRTLSGLTDGRTEGQTDGRTDRLTDSEETYSPPPPPPLWPVARGLINFNTENVDALKTLRINWSRP